MKVRLLAALCLLLPALAAQAAIVGALVDEQGKPLAGATIRAYPAEGWKSIARRLLTGAVERPVVATAKTADNGAFTLDTKQPLVELVIEGDGLQPRTLEAADPDDLDVLVMRPAKARKLRLVNGTKGVPNAIVAAGPLIVRSDAEGYVDFPMAATRVFIVHPDFAPMSDFSSGEPQVKELALNRGVAIKGRVLAEDGQPVANASISVSGWPLAESAADGSFTIAHAPANWRTLRASDATRAGTLNNTRASSYDIKLQAAATIAGTTTPGARVYFDASATDFDLLESTIADAQGKFSAMLPARPYSLRVTRPGYQFGRADLVVQKGQTVTKTMSLKPLSAVRGRVVDEQKQPVDGAFVWSGVAGASANSQFVRTSPSGEFAVRYSDPPGGMFRPQVYAVKAGYAAGTATIASASPVMVTLPRGFPLEVRIVDRQGKRVPGANLFFTYGDEEVFAGRFEAACEQPLSTTCRTTDDSGALHYRVVAGNYIASVRGDSIVMRNQMKQPVTAASGPVTIEVDRGVEITGRVAYSDRSPAIDAMVMSRGWGPGAVARTDADGFFTMRNILPGKVTLVATDGSRVESTPLDVEAPVRGISLTIPAPARVEGRVIDKETSAPVTDFQVAVVLHQPNGGFSSGIPTSFHREDGSFVLDRVSPRSVDLYVVASGYARGLLNNLALEEGKTLRAPDIQLDQGGSLRGRVTANGQPVSGANVRPGDSRGPMTAGSSQTTTDENGEYVLDSLRPGEQTFSFDHQGFVTRRKTIDVAKAKETRLDIELDRGQQLQGRVVDKNGAPVANARVSLRSNSGGSNARPVMTDQTGNFTIEAIADGKYNVLANKEGFVEAVANDVTIPATAPVTLTLDTGGTLSGRVIGLTPAELVSVEVSAFGRGSSARANVNSDGMFTLKGIPDGRISINAFLRGGPRIRQSVPQSVEVVNGAGPAIQIDFNEGLTVTGRVSRSGLPVTNGSVNFNGPKVSRSGSLTPDGTYTVDGLLAGDYSVTVNTQMGSLYRAKYTVASNGSYDITIEGAAIHGHIVDASTGAPLSDMNVYTIGSRANSVQRQAISDSAGQFTFEAMPDGQVDVRVSPRQKYAMQTQTITVANGSAAEIEFKLEPVQPTLFRVTDSATGAALDPMISIVNGKTPVGGGGGPRDDDGVTRIYVPPGSYTARVMARGYILENVNFTTPGPEVRVALMPAGKLIIIASKPARVRVVPATPPASGGVVGGMISGGPMATPEGMPFENLRPGPYRVDVIGDDNKTVLRSLPVTVISGQTITVRVD